MTNLNNIPSPYGEDGKLLTFQQYQKKCELINKANKELESFANALGLMCSFAKPKERLGGNFIKKS
jgi:hypothetical protein